MLLSETGRTLIEHTYRSASQSQLVDEVWVATDHKDIFQAVEAFGGNVLMTDPAHRSGTDRIAEAAKVLKSFEIFVNVQGDEPEISGSAIDLAVQRLSDSPEANVATLATPIRSKEALADPSVVKVVSASNHRAIYFSRSIIPHPRGLSESDLEAALADGQTYFQHVGLYAYRREFLECLPDLAPSQAEDLEQLEQLRFLENQRAIYVDQIQDATSGIDTPADYDLFVKRWQNG